MAIAIALAFGVLAAPASAGTWSSLTAPQANWDQPFTLGYTGSGQTYAVTSVGTAGPTDLFVRPAAGGAFASVPAPFPGSGPPPGWASDNVGRVVFVAGQGGDILYRRRGPSGTLAPASALDIGNGLLPALSVNGATGEFLAAWPDAVANALTVKLGTFSGSFSTDTLTGPPTVGTPLVLPSVFAALDSDDSGVIVYTDDNAADGDLSFIVRDPAATPKWGAATAVPGTTTINSFALYPDPSGDAMLLWANGSGNHAAFRAHDTSTFSADDPPPAGNVVSAAIQADGSGLVVVVNPSTGDATLYRRAADGSGWNLLSGPHTLNSLAGLNNAVVAASRTGDKIAFAWTQKPADVGTQAYRVFAQVGTAADLGAATALPSQPATPSQTSSNHNELPTIAVDPSANAVALWRAFRSPSDPVGGLVDAAIFDPAGTTPPPDEPGGNNPPPGGGTTPPPTTAPPTNLPTTNLPSDGSAERLLGFALPRTGPVSNALNLPVFCARSHTRGCNGAIGVVVAGSYPLGDALIAIRKSPRARFSYKLKTVVLSLRPGQRKTIKIKYPKVVFAAVKRALRHRSGKVTVTVRATLLKR